MTKRSKKLKGMDRAYASKDSYRLTTNVPLITGATELVTPEIAKKMLQKNSNNRKISWPKVEQYKKIMIAGEWQLHAQGIILDNEDNILTGQKRLYAIIFSDIPQYMHISRGTPAQSARLLDRGTAQSARDLASRQTSRRHAVAEATIARAICAAEGKMRPNADLISDIIFDNDEILKEAIDKTQGIKKTKALIMILAAICFLNKLNLFAVVTQLSEILEEQLKPITPEECWKRGAAFTLAMSKAVDICKKYKI